MSASVVTLDPSKLFALLSFLRTVSIVYGIEWALSSGAWLLLGLVLPIGSLCSLSRSVSWSRVLVADFAWGHGE
jgi:hypothetical protein